MSTVALFVDGANMFYAQRQQGWHIDWAAVLQHFSDGKQICGAFYFTATPAAANTWDQGVLMGMDLDYIPIITHLRNLGKAVICVGRRQMTSLELINAATSYIELEQLRKLIEKKK